jgi:hypothetical protein
MDSAQNSSEPKATESRQLAVQIHLAEFSALRSEMLEIIKWREQLVFFSLGISGALFSFGLPSLSRQDVSPSYLALYLIPPLGAAMEALWVANTLKINRIGKYIRDVLRKKLNDLLAGARTTEQRGALDVFAWEDSTERSLASLPRRLGYSVVLISAFVLAGAVAQVLVLAPQSGSIRQRFVAVHYPLLYSLNWAILLVTLATFLLYLTVPRSQHADRIIR